MRINGTFLLTAVLLLGAFFLVRSPEGFLQVLGFVFLAGACLVQFRFLVKSVLAYRKSQVRKG